MLGFLFVEGVLEVVADMGDDFIVDDGAELGFAFWFSRGKVSAAGFEEFVLVFLFGFLHFLLTLEEDGEFSLVEADGIFGRSGSFVFLMEDGEVHAMEAFKKRIPLHDLVVEIRKRGGFIFIDDEGEPEAESGDFDSAEVEIDTVDGFLDDVFLQFCSLGRVIEV